MSTISDLAKARQASIPHRVSGFKSFVGGLKLTSDRYVKKKTNSTTAKLTSTNKKYNTYNRQQLIDLYCQRTIMSGKKPLPAQEAELLRGSTVIKILELDGWSLFCKSISASNLENYTDLS
jgi:hypothetical protein